MNKKKDRNFENDEKQEKFVKKIFYTHFIYGNEFSFIVEFMSHLRKNLHFFQEVFEYVCMSFLCKVFHLRHFDMFKMNFNILIQNDILVVFEVQE